MNDKLDLFEHMLLGITLWGVTLEFHFDFGGSSEDLCFYKFYLPAPMGIKK